MLFLPVIILFVVFRQTWVRTIAALVWFLGFIVSIEVWPMYLIATAIWYPIVALIVWLIRRAIASKRRKPENETANS